MPATAPRMDPALFGNLKSGDERAFERLFREQYRALIDEVTPLVHGDGAAAARGIENVFAHVWKEREHFTTPDMLDAFLRQAVHEAAARINSRHAIAHQLGEHDGAHATRAVVKPAPSVDDAWKKVNSALHPNAEHAAELAHEMAVHSRHEAAAQIAELARPRPWGATFAVMVVAVIAIGGFLWWSNRGSELTTLTASLSAADTHVANTGIGEFNKASLSDGSVVRIGPDSHLKIPRTYGDAVRGTQLEGTAVFSVASGQHGKFMVLAGPAIITATGTEFVVRAYPDEGGVTVSVIEGTVDVKVGDSTVTLTQGGALAIAPDKSSHTPSAAELTQATGWTDGTVVATDRTVKDMVVIAKRWFGVQLFVPDSTLLGRKVSVNAKIGASEAAIASIEKSGGLKRGWEGTNMVLRAARR